MVEASWQPFKSNLLFLSAYQVDYKMIKSEIIENLFFVACALILSETIFRF